MFLNIAILLMATAMGGTLTGCEEETAVDYDYAYNVADLALGKTNVSFGKKGGTQTVNVQSTQAVSAVSDASWLVVQVGGQSATLKSTPITLTVDENISGQVRNADLIVTAGGQSQTIKVIQSADLAIDLVSPNVVAGEGGAVTVTVRSESAYTIIIPSEAQSWLTLASMPDFKDVYAGTMTSTTFTLNVSGHIGDQRRAEVTVRTTSTDGRSVIEETFAIVQEARESSIDTEATAMSIAAQMFPGWNLGNTMEGTSGSVGLGDETGWQPTKTSQAVIDFVKAQGFRSIRIPCAWVMGHIIDASDYTIDPVWMNRVKEIVDYSLKAGLYVVINQHWDGGWLENNIKDATQIPKNKFILNKIWQQIAETFRDYDERLLFAGLNEQIPSLQPITWWSMSRSSSIPSVHQEATTPCVSLSSRDRVRISTIPVTS